MRRPVIGRSGVAWLCVGLVAGGLACAGPIVVERLVERDPDALHRIAVAPFLPARTFRASPRPGSPSAAEAVGLVSRFVSDALVAHEFDVIPASDVQLAFEGRGIIVPRGDPATLAGLVAQEFGATGVLMGTVQRYAERQGGEYGAEQPASVGFELTLYSAPGARKLWVGRFDHTQASFTADPLEARRYPGRGSRWLTAAELLQWGADAAAAALAEQR